ncbi:hypothetical protein [Foetidibacter luteolus]|uniref:hypothetical protein n=1 Tax=Foetidibacter luteolus TaxID=2608880 RepID=UPI00129A5295|nr:hypothetical protein [Foetidibacter luteolus]
MNKVLVVLFLISSCVYEPRKPLLAIFINKSPNAIYILYESYPTDDGLWYGTRHFINANSTYRLYGPDNLPGNDKKVHLFILHADSINTYIKLGQKNDIFKKSLIEEYVIERDSLRKNKTIIYYGKNLKHD